MRSIAAVRRHTTTKGEMKAEAISPAAAARLPLYVRTLRNMARDGVEMVCSQDLSYVTGLEAHQIRKDLSHLGTLGKRGVGYNVHELLSEISEYLSLLREWRLAIIGCGRLGGALAGHLLATSSNIRLCAVFDCSSRKVGTRVGNIEVTSWDRIPAVARERLIDMAIVATPPLAAQRVANLAIEGGVRLILNYSPTILSVPDQVFVRNVDLASEIVALSLHLSSRSPVRHRASARPAIAWVTL